MIIYKTLDLPKTTHKLKIDVIWGGSYGGRYPVIESIYEDDIDVTDAFIDMIDFSIEEIEDIERDAYEQYVEGVERSFEDR